MRIRASRTLVLLPDHGRVIVFNFLTRSQFSSHGRIIELLLSLYDWHDEEAAAALFPGFARESVTRELRKLVDLTALVADTGPERLKEEEFAAAWEWPLPCALFHFSLQDSPFMPLEAGVERQIERAARDPSPPLRLSNKSLQDVRRLPPVASDPLSDIMVRRRTCRTAMPAPLQLDELADCLFAGLGITGETVTGTGALPLSMTPSGGARNPFEAYLLVRNVEGLEPGFYHYSAAEHSLGRIETNRLRRPSDLLAHQDWTDSMPCIVFLIAYFERTMWKYPDANAYRVILIEAGHIGQNIMLAATRHGLSACPTAALAHSAIQEALRLEGPTRAPLYALTIGRPCPSQIGAGPGFAVRGGHSCRPGPAALTDQEMRRT